MEKHSRVEDGVRLVWSTERLWSLSKSLPERRVRIDQIREFDQDCWFGGRPATCREVAEHARRILNADLSFPIILSADGQLMDGGHRIAKAWLAGAEIITAVQFMQDPEPDWTEPL